MSFEQFINRTAPRGEEAGRFDHSSQTLPMFEKPTADQLAELSVKAREIASEIGHLFDADLSNTQTRVNAAMSTINAYWQAPVPFGVLPTPPPLSAFVEWVDALTTGLASCHEYDADARKLALAGAPEFETYIKPTIDDLTKAIATARSTNTGMLSSSPANHGAPPGPLPAVGFGALSMPPMFPPFMPMPEMGHSQFSGGGSGLGIPMGFQQTHAWPGSFSGFMPAFGLPFLPSPPVPFAPTPGTAVGPAAPTVNPMIAEMKAETEQLQQMNRDRQKAFDDANRKFDDYIKS